ncbi:hypothetical protein LTS18_006329, partial [Coniosporium uncinatum]
MYLLTPFLPLLLALTTAATPAPVLLARTVTTTVTAPAPSCTPVRPTCNTGTLYCCQATFAGDLRIIQILAGAVEFELDDRDVNCID